MTNTATNTKNRQQNHLSSNKYSNDSELSNMSSLSGSEGQKRRIISVTLLGDGRKANDIDDNQSSEAFSTSSPRAEKGKESEKEGADDRSSGVHMVYNVDSHKKPTIKGTIAIEKFKENEKRDKPSEKSRQDEGRVEERGVVNFSDLKSPKDDDEKKYKSNNSVFYASIVTKDVNVPDKNGRIHQVPKNYMKVKVPKSPKTPNNHDNNYASRGAEVYLDDDNNTPTSNRRRVKKKVPKYSGNDSRYQKPQLSISKDIYNHTPTTLEGQPEKRRAKHKKDNNKYIPSDYNQPQFPPTPNYFYPPYNFHNNNNGGPYIELEIVPEEDSNIEERYPAKATSKNRRSKKQQHIHHHRSSSKDRRRRQRPTSRGSRGTYYYSDEYDDSYYDSYDDNYNQYSNEGRRPTKRRRDSANSSTQNIDSASTQTDNASENARERTVTPKFEQPPTPTQNVGTETKLNRNSSSTQTSFLHNSRATKSVETSSLGQNKNDIFDNVEDNADEEDTNENVFNSPKNSPIRERSKAYQNSPGSPSSPKTFNVPRSPHSPRSQQPTYKSEAEGLSNSARIITRSSNLNANNDNSNEVSVNRVPNSSDDEDGNVENDLSISSLEKKIKQIKPRSTKDRKAEFEEEQQKAASSPKYLSESNSESQHDGSNLFDKKESSKHSKISNKDESYEECVLNPSRGSSLLSRSKQSAKSNHSRSQLSESQEDSNEQPHLEDEEEEEEEKVEKRESSHMSTKSNHSKPASRHVSAENSLSKGKSSHVSSSFNLNVPSQNQANSITTESTKQPSLINEPSSSKKNGQSSKVSFNSHMSHTSNKPSNASKSTINIESEVQDFITPDKKSTSSKKPSSKQNSLISEKSNHNNSNIGSSINSLHNSKLGSSIHSPHNSKIGSSLHSIHNSNGTNSIVSENSTHQNPSLISNNSASTFLGDKAQNQFSAAFDNLSEITTSDVSDRFIKKRGFEIDSIIDSSVTNNSAISIGSNATDKAGSVLIEEIEEEEVEEEMDDSQATKGGDSNFSNLFDESTKHSNELSSDFNLFSSETSTIKSRRVNKRLVDPSELYMKLGLQVLETKTRDPRVTEAEAENPALSNSIHDVQIEPAVPTEPKSLFVQIGFKDQDTILSTPTRKCQKLSEPESPDEAFSTNWNSNYLVTGFENSAILFTLCRTEFSGFKKLASVNIPLFSFKDLSDGWFELIPENDDDETKFSAPNSPKSPKSGIYGKIHIISNIESAISLPPFDIDKQVEIIASRDQINLDNRNQEEIERIKAISFDLSSNSNSSSIHESDDFEAQKKKLSRKFSNFKGQFSSVSDVSVAYMNSENADSEGHRIRQRKIGLNSNSNLNGDDTKFNSSSSHSRRRKRESQNSNSVKSEREDSLNDANNFDSASSSTKRRRIKVPKNSNNSNNNQQKTDSGFDNLSFSAHSSSSHGGSKPNKKLSSASGDQGFQFEMISSSSTSKKKQNQNDQDQGSFNKQNQSRVSNVNNTELSNYLKDVSSTMPETLTFGNSSTNIGASNLTMSAFQSPQKNAEGPAPVATTSYKNSIDDDDDDEIDEGIVKLSISTESGNSDAPNDYAEVKKEKTLSRDPPKRTHVTSSNKKESDASFEDLMKDFDDSC